MFSTVYESRRPKDPAIQRSIDRSISQPQPCSDLDECDDDRGEVVSQARLCLVPWLHNELGGRPTRNG